MKKVLYVAVIIISFFIIYNLLHSIYNLWQKQDLLVTAQKQLDKQKKENSQLKAELQYVSRPEYIEEQARNKLLLVKPGEQLLLLPSITKKASPSTAVHITSTLPHWQEWINLFFPGTF